MWNDISYKMFGLQSMLAQFMLRRYNSINMPQKYFPFRSWTFLFFFFFICRVSSLLPHEIYLFFSLNQESIRAIVASTYGLRRINLNVASGPRWSSDVRPSLMCSLAVFTSSELGDVPFPSSSARNR